MAVSTNLFCGSVLSSLGESCSSWRLIDGVNCTY
jgi:hypothetical protein